jgi:hypothetical protein
MGRRVVKNEGEDSGGDQNCVETDEALIVLPQCEGT